MALGWAASASARSDDFGAAFSVPDEGVVGGRKIGEKVPESAEIARQIIINSNPTSTACNNNGRCVYSCFLYEKRGGKFDKLAEATAIARQRGYNREEEEEEEEDDDDDDEEEEEEEEEKDEGAVLRCREKLKQHKPRCPPDQATGQDTITCRREEAPRAFCLCLTMPSLVGTGWFGSGRPLVQAAWPTRHWIPRRQLQLHLRSLVPSHPHSHAHADMTHASTTAQAAFHTFPVARFLLVCSADSQSCISRNPQDANLLRYHLLPTCPPVCPRLPHFAFPPFYLFIRLVLEARLLCCLARQARALRLLKP
ncbi:unnamed protein product [Protopolystoma xenopodis]|uniref:Uncharacterized protein n=1 Tax=Protopolystoma xenopodis TaxID=117903 RepID=A0A448XI15_9PLAT|nr:unnamed protein product [Protopolystoma xenopodis]